MGGRRAANIWPGPFFFPFRPLIFPLMELVVDETGWSGGPLEHEDVHPGLTDSAGSTRGVIPTPPPNPRLLWILPVIRQLSHRGRRVTSSWRSAGHLLHQGVWRLLRKRQAGGAGQQLPLSSPPVSTRNPSVTSSLEFILMLNS